MATIHAFKRSQKTTHEFNGVTHTFERNASGHVTCDIEDEAAIERFLSIHGAFRLYATEQATEAPMSPLLTALANFAQDVTVAVVEAPKLPVEVAFVPVESVVEVVDVVQTPPASPYLIKDADGMGTDFDLRGLDDVGLRDFAKVNGIKLHNAAKGDAIRDKIIEALKE